jgi:hypothetical protein
MDVLMLQGQIMKTHLSVIFSTRVPAMQSLQSVVWQSILVVFFSISRTEYIAPYGDSKDVYLGIAKRKN